MKLLIIHANDVLYDRSCSAMKCIQELTDYFLPEDVIDLNDVAGDMSVGALYERGTGRELILDNEGIKYVEEHLEKGYVNHNGLLKYSKEGELDNIIDLIKEEDKFVLAGGSLGGCHKRAFNNLIRFTEKKNLEINLVGETVYTNKNSTMNSLDFAGLKKIIQKYNFSAVTFDSTNNVKWNWKKVEEEGERVFSLEIKGKLWQNWLPKNVITNYFDNNKLFKLSLN
ncbi:hypothetical protein COX58_03025 [archaeon CG_4_10_14_0_2_um_filter_Archaea_38_6]|nr:MAG: hypothetical protein COS83_00685 [archaeon CG07_land_8_20_14_0_80_38_8]PIU88258.1 MAG: hypothetical protein COS64_04450 [archaeon CG06_land_8_20_14_3_00_37_11]PJA21991.1 MAG: hypothetical protein COX58_03025 [archaeon CG_4_10_14_0_2_um_filter_Archaea_38_6]